MGAINSEQNFSYSQQQQPISYNNNNNMNMRQRMGMDQNNQLQQQVLQPQYSYAFPYNQNGIFKGRFVTSFDEVKASQIDFDGSTYFFPDTTQTRIYTKKVNNDGTVDYGVFEKIKTPSQNSNNQFVNDNYITKAEFTAMINALKEKFSQLEKKENANPENDIQNNAIVQQSQETIEFNF